MSQVPEESFTLAEYRNVFKKRFEFTAITVLGSDANGTHFQWDDALGERHFGVISDLVGGHIVRSGEVNATIVANSTGVIVNVTLDPPLPNFVDFRAWANLTLSSGLPASTPVSVSAALTSASNLRLILNRPPLATTLSNAAANLGHTVDSVDVLVVNPHSHTTDAASGLFHDGDDGAGNHTHAISYAQGSGTFTVEWWIASISD